MMLLLVVVVTLCVPTCFDPSLAASASELPGKDWLVLSCLLSLEARNQIILGIAVSKDKVQL